MSLPQAEVIVLLAMSSMLVNEQNKINKFSLNRNKLKVIY